MEIVAVKINCKGKIYYFKNDSLKLRKNCTVIVDNEDYNMDKLWILLTLIR